MEEYKPNSFKSKEEAKQTEKKEIKQIVSTPAIKKKRSFGDTLSEALSKCGDYIWKEVLKPAAKKTVQDVVNNGVDILLYGESGSQRRSNIPGSRVSYQSYYERNSRNNDYGYSRPTYSSGFNYENVILQNRIDAENVLTEMDNIIRRYTFVKVADLYDLVGITGSYTDNNYGWTDLRSAKVKRVEQGYMLDLPKPMPID